MVLLLNIYSKIIFPGGLPQTPHFIASRAPQGADFKEKSLYKDEKYMDICMNVCDGAHTHRAVSYTHLTLPTKRIV